MVFAKFAKKKLVGNGKPNHVYISLDDFIEIWDFVLENSFFQYGPNIVRQLQGIFMGMHAGSAIVGLLSWLDIYTAEKMWFAAQRKNLYQNLFVWLFVEADDWFFASGRLAHEFIYRETHTGFNILRRRLFNDRASFFDGLIQLM